MAAQKYLTIGDGGTASASPNPNLGYFLQGHSQATGATLKVGPDSSNHTIAVVAQQGTPSPAYGQELDYSTGNLKLTHGINLSNGHLIITNKSGGTVTLNGDSTVANYSQFRAEGPVGPFARPGSFVLNGSLTVSNSIANFQDAKVSGHGTINIRPGGPGPGIFGGSTTVTMDNVLAGLHVNVGNHSQLVLMAQKGADPIAFHGTITEAASSLVDVYGAAHSAVREIFHTATGTLNLLDKFGTKVASLQFAPGSREYTSINPHTQFAAITTDPHVAGTLPTIFTH